MKKGLKEDLISFRNTFQDSLKDYVYDQTEKSIVRTRDATKLVKIASRFVLRPGKRLRPYLLMKTASLLAKRTSSDATRAGIALELFHDYALIHDDVLDQSDMRRGKPTIHKLYETEHKKKDWAGSSAHYGRSGAILAGDIVCTWADRAMQTACSNQTVQQALLTAWTQMKEEVILGQAGDITMSVLRYGISRSQLLYMTALKSGRYSIAHPIMMGYILAGHKPSVSTILSFAEPLGIAFQLQDDILSTFGDSKRTGKDTGSDLREGKMTLLAWETQKRLTPSELREWDSKFGQAQATSEDIEFLKTLIEKSGARTYVQTLSQQLIEHGMERASAIPVLSQWLLGLATFLQERTV